MWQRAPQVQSVVIGLLVLLVAAGSTTEARAASPGVRSVLRADTLRSPTIESGEPIPIEAVEVIAPRMTLSSSRDRMKIRVGRVTASLEGLATSARPAGGAVDRAATASWTAETNLMTGVVLAAPATGTEALYLEGARAGLRDPIDIFALAGATREYWQTSAGIQVRF